MTEPSLLYQHIGDLLAGISGAYVDDIVRIGDLDFMGASDQTLTIFDCTPKTLKTGKFLGYIRHCTFRQVIMIQSIS